MHKPRIFISATTRGLKSYRELASKSLRKRHYDVDDQAIFDLTYLEIHDKLKRRIADCDAVVCLIGFFYGGEPSQRPPGQRRRSYTQWEFYFARELKKPVYILRADKTTPFDPDPYEPESKAKQELQLKYYNQVIRDRDWGSFNGPEQLRAELAELHFPWEPPRPEHKPNNLPLATIGTLFKGREASLDDLRNRLGVPDGRATAIVNRLAVHGLGGVGKTRVAVEYAWRHAEDYTALLFVSGASAAELKANLASLVGVLGTLAKTASVDEQLGQVYGRPPALYPWSFTEPLGFRAERGLVLVLHTPRRSSPPGSPTAGRSPGEPRVLVPNDRDEVWTVPPEYLPLARRLGRGARLGARVQGSLGFRPADAGYHAEDRPQDGADGGHDRRRRRHIQAELRNLRETCTTIDDFNGDVAIPEVADELRAKFRKDADSPSVPEFDEPHNRWLLCLGRLRDAAGAVARHMQRRVYRALAWVFLLLGLSVLAFHLYAHWFDEEARPLAHNPALLLLFLLLLTGAALRVAAVWWARLEERWLDSRALAEALRVRRPWALAGLGLSVADSYVRQHRGEVNWIGV